jgi:hypothetical protein
MNVTNTKFINYWLVVVSGLAMLAIVVGSAQAAERNWSNPVVISLESMATDPENDA